MIRFLTKPRNQQAKNIPAAINCVDDKRYIQLLTAMFRSIVFIEENQNEMDPNQLKIWVSLSTPWIIYKPKIYRTKWSISFSNTSPCCTPSIFVLNSRWRR